MTKLPIKFGLKAERRWDGTFFVLEWFETPKLENQFEGQSARQSCGIVDGGVVASHSKEYFAFKDHKETFAEILYPRAIAAYPNVLFDLEIKSPGIPNAEDLTPAEPEKKGRKRKNEKDTD